MSGSQNPFNGRIPTLLPQNHIHVSIHTHTHKQTYIHIRRWSNKFLTLKVLKTQFFETKIPFCINTQFSAHTHTHAESYHWNQNSNVFEPNIHMYLYVCTYKRKIVQTDIKLDGQMNVPSAYKLSCNANKNAEYCMKSHTLTQIHIYIY